MVIDLGDDNINYSYRYRIDLTKFAWDHNWNLHTGVYKEIIEWLKNNNIQFSIIPNYVFLNNEKDVALFLLKWS